MKLLKDNHSLHKRKVQVELTDLDLWFLHTIICQISQTVLPVGDWAVGLPHALQKHSWATYTAARQIER